MDNYTIFHVVPSLSYFIDNCANSTKGFYLLMQLFQSSNCSLHV